MNALIIATASFALGAGGMWLWMRGRVALASAAVLDAREDRDDWIAQSCHAINAAHSRWVEACDARAVARLNGEAVQYWQDIATRIRTLCSKRKDSTAIAVMKMIGDGK